jgi:crotonobetainyl-CoA:carnitine CoA-transferase CaiB-like acyl-CoA transferase
MGTKRSTEPSPKGPLAHIKVVDLTHARAGPTCVRVLADHGAQVTQVTRVDLGSFDSIFLGSDQQNLHRNKRSIAINLRSEAGCECCIGWSAMRTS